MQQFEIRIIRAHWVKKEVLLKVETADEPIHLQDEGDGNFSADILAYPELGPHRFGQVGVCVSDPSVTPTLIQADENAIKLSPLRASDGRIWWVEMGKWKKIPNGTGYYDAPLCRHAGQAHLQVGQSSVSLKISPPGFTEDEFEILLDEFRNGLWQLVLDTNSPVTAIDYNSTAGVSEAFLDAVRDHLLNVHNALDQPHSELRERQEQQLLTRVRPITKTFQELATRGNPRYITGRGHAPSYNTPENQQLATMTHRLLRAMQALHRAARGAAGDFEKRAEDSKTRLHNLENSKGYIKVDSRRLQQEIDEVISKQQILNQKITLLYLEKPLGKNVHKLQIYVDSEIEEKYSEIGFWSNLQAVDEKKKNLRVKFVFGDHDSDLLSNIFIKGMEYVIHGHFEHIPVPGQTTWFKYKVLGILSMVPVTLEKQLRYLQKGQSYLRTTNFSRKANHQEVREQNRDCKAESEREKRFNIAKNLWAKTAYALEPLIMQSAKMIERMSSLGISHRLNLTLSGSMAYVQNPNYRGSLSAYRRAMEAASLDTSKLDQLFHLDEVGILDLPMVYERWCLLKIIRTLIEQFRLTPEPAYRDNLFQTLTSDWSGKSTLTIRFQREEIGREVLLEYQPIIRRKGRKDRTPDYTLTVGALGSQQSLFEEDYYSKLVLDAKCKRFVPITSEKVGAKLSDELDELITKRGYDEEKKNRVFVIHPGWDSTSSEEWREYSHYGGGHFTTDSKTRPDWDKGNPDHSHGAVLLRPGTTDHLFRLILMHLYLGLDDTSGAYSYREPRFSQICPACGGAEMVNYQLNQKRLSQRVNHNAVWCKECQQLIVRNHSGTCGTHLWKLGGYWTFHETDPLNPYNIKCPHCGDYMIINNSADDKVLDGDEIHAFY